MAVGAPPTYVGAPPIYVGAPPIYVGEPAIYVGEPAGIVGPLLVAVGATPIRVECVPMGGESSTPGVRASRWTSQFTPASRWPPWKSGHHTEQTLPRRRYRTTLEIWILKNSIYLW